MSSNAKRIYKDSSESFRNGNRALKGSLRSRGSVNKFVAANQRASGTGTKLSKATYGVEAK